MRLIIRFIIWSIFLIQLTVSAYAKDDNIRIGAIYLDAQGYYAGVRVGLQNRAQEVGKNIEVIETNARGDASKESSFINTLTAAKVDALIISAVSSDGSARAVEKAAKAGIPVICYNTCVNEETLKSSVYAYAIGDPYKFGEKIGHVAANYIKENAIKKANIGIINCEQYEVCILRREGFEAALTAAGISYEIISNQEGTELDKAISIGEQMLSANPSINLIFGESGGATLGGIKAVENMKKQGEIVVFGSDMTTEIANKLQEYTVLKGEVDISGKVMGALAFDLAMKAINGEALADKIVQAPIDLYQSAKDGAYWLKTHPDGLP